MAVMREPSPPMPASPPGLQAVIHKCLEKDRVNRYQSIAELAQALEPFASNRAEAAVIVQRTVSLARPRVQTPAAGVPVLTPAGPATPAHGNPPMMSTPAHGMAPTHGGQPLMTTPAHGMRPTHGGQPLMTTPAHGMRPTHGGQPLMSTPAHGNQPHMSTPANGMPPSNQPHTSTPAHGMPPSNQPHTSTPAHGMPPSGGYAMTSSPGISPSATAPSSNPPAPTSVVAKSNSRVVLFIVIGVVAGSIAGAVIMFAT
jgi:serine/threonine-protein kinase